MGRRVERGVVEGERWLIEGRKRREVRGGGFIVGVGVGGLGECSCGGVLSVRIIRGYAMRGTSCSARRG